MLTRSLYILVRNLLSPNMNTLIDFYLSRKKNSRVLKQQLPGLVCLVRYVLEIVCVCISLNVCPWIRLTVWAWNALAFRKMVPIQLKLQGSMLLWPSRLLHPVGHPCHGSQVCFGITQSMVQEDVFSDGCMMST